MNYQSDNYLPVVVFFSKLPKTNSQPTKQHKIIQFGILSANMEQGTKNDRLAEMKYLWNVMT